MRLSKLCIFFSLLIARICRSGIIIETSKTEQSRLIKAAVNVVKDCYVDRVSTVGLAGDAEGRINELLWLWEHIPVTLIDTTQRIFNDGPVTPESRYRLQLFVVIATSSLTLSEALKGIKESRWWNHLASVLIVDWSMPGCSNRFEVLWTAWELNLLASNFLCLDETKSWLIYTYNPYTNKAPKPWHLENTYRGKNNHTWTLFVRRYREDEDICDELDFDKTTDLGGYTIRVSVANESRFSSKVDKNRNRATELNAQIAWLLFRALNATPMILEETTYDNVDHNGKLIGVPFEMRNEISDFAVDFRYRLYIEDFAVTYPFWESGLCIMSQYRGSASQLSKIASIIDGYSKLGLCLVCLITVVFFALFLRNSLSSSILNTLLLICNAALLKIPKNLAPRIYLATIFIFFVNIQGIFQGKLAALLTKNVDLRNVENVEDLSKYGYTVYGPPRNAHFFKNTSPPIPFFPGIDNIEECLDHPRRNSTVACVLEKTTLIPYAEKFNLHLSTDPIVAVYWIYMMRDNWPPQKKLDTFLRRLVEADIIQIIYDKELGKSMRKLKAIDDMKSDQSFEILTLPDLNFAFAFLAIGLTCASICFIVEIGIARIRSQRLCHLRR